MLGVSTLLSFSFILLVAVIYSVLILGCTYANNRSNSPSPIAIYILRFAIGGFLLITGWLAIEGFYLQFDSNPPKIFYAIIPGFIGMLVLAFHPRVADWLKIIPQSFLILLQSFRIFVEIVLYYLAMTPHLPQLLTFEGRNFDILIGLSAPVVGHFVHHAKTPTAKSLMRKVTYIWNILGLILITNVVVNGILSAPTPFQRIFADPSNTAFGHFPFIWLPAFLVPMAYLLHFLSLKKLSLDRKN